MSMSNYQVTVDKKYQVHVDRKYRQLLRWPDGFPDELKFSVKLGFWVWLCTTAALLILIKVD